jgi:hypothetical protein
MQIALSIRLLEVSSQLHHYGVELCHDAATASVVPLQDDLWHTLKASTPPADAGNRDDATYHTPLNAESIFALQT